MITTLQPRQGALVLAAGESKRMHLGTSKILEPLCGKAIIEHIIDALLPFFQVSHIGIVLGFHKEECKKFLLYKYPDIKIIEQQGFKGTGAAVQSALKASFFDTFDEVFILPGDTPLVTAAAIGAMLKPCLGQVRSCAVRLQDPYGYGRIIQESKNTFKIVEQSELTLEQQSIDLVNTGLYLCKVDFLKQYLPQLQEHKPQQEIYLTDLLSFSLNTELLEWKSADDMLGVNTCYDLSIAAQKMQHRICRSWALQGVRFLNINFVYIEASVRLSAGCILHPGAMLKGSTVLGTGVQIGAGAVLEDVQVGKNTTILPYTVISRAYVGEHCSLGPFAHMRPGCNIQDKVKIGNFVELKNVTVAQNTKISHLSYLGDAKVGQNVNIGCGFITCNYDGHHKHTTIIEDSVFMGSDSQAIAPITIGEGAYVASGTTLTEDVPPGALAIGRAQQVNKPDYAKKLKS